MIFAMLILLVANYSSVGGTDPKPVTVTIIYGKGGESVKLNALDRYDEIEKIGTLIIYGAFQSEDEEIPLQVLEKINSALQNDEIARSYYLNQPLPVRITMDKSNEHEISNTDNSDELQIMPNVQGNFLTVNSNVGWAVEIPYRPHDVKVGFTETKCELTLLLDWYQIFDCTVSMLDGADGEMWLALKINKTGPNAPVNFMNLQNSAEGIFLQEKEQPQEDSAEEEKLSQEPVLQARIGYIQDLGEEYYAEIKLQPDEIVVKITTPGPVHRVRAVDGLAPKGKNEILIFPGSCVYTVSSENPKDFVPSTYDILWAFDGATSLQVSSQTFDGKIEGFSEIVNAKLDQKKLTYKSGVRTLIILPCHAAHPATIIPN